MSTLADPAPVTVAELVAAVRDQRFLVTEADACPDPSTTKASAVVVVGAHAGAGATVVAVGIADALSQRVGATEEVHLVDLAAAESSGMAEAAGCEIGSPYDGWRAGRRGEVTLLRPAHRETSVRSIPKLDGGLLVLDPGRQWLDLVGSGESSWGLFRQEQVVVVCRGTVPGIRRAELVLAALDAEPILAVVGSRRWPREVEASFGPGLTDVVDAGRAVLVPADRSVEINGVASRPLPKSVAAAAGRLAELIGPGVPAHERHRAKGFHR